MITDSDQLINVCKARDRQWQNYKGISLAVIIFFGFVIIYGMIANYISNDKDKFDKIYIQVHILGMVLLAIGFFANNWRGNDVYKYIIKNENMLTKNAPNQSLKGRM